jgi:hypothetical protein
MSDITKELREAALRAEQEGEPLALLDDAADEIARLRLTDEEREVLTNTREWMLYGNRHGVDKAPPIIDALLKRHAKGGAA